MVPCNRTGGIMRKHLTDGELRAALDGELDGTQLQHLDTCAACQARKKQLKLEVQERGQLLSFLSSTEKPVPDVGKAWSRFTQQLITRKENSMFKKWFAFPVVRFASALVLILVLVLAFPSTRA